MSTGRVYACAGVLVAVAAVTITAGPHSAERRRTADELRAAGVPENVVSTVDRACLDCHSADTRWPWYAHVPLLRQEIESDVSRGRRFLDFSKWSTYTPGQRLGYAIAISNAAGASMPPQKYVFAHWSAKVGADERETLSLWAKAERASLLRSRTRARNAASR